MHVSFSQGQTVNECHRGGYRALHRELKDTYSETFLVSVVATVRGLMFGRDGDISQSRGVAELLSVSLRS